MEFESEINKSLPRYCSFTYTAAYSANENAVSASLFRLCAGSDLFFRLPLGNQKISGIKVKEIVQKVQDLDERVLKKDNIKFGHLLENEESTTWIGCRPNTLTKHALIVGMPGTGKTTFSVHLLLQMYRSGIPFLAIEPTKTEYRALIDQISDLQIFTPGKNKVSPFVINPFLPPKGITVEQYIPSLLSAFKAAFSMPSPLDTIFQQAVQEVYIKYGWRDYSTVEDFDVKKFGLYEFIQVFKELIERQKYSAEVKGNLMTGGIFRLRELINQNPNIYDSVESVPLEDLLCAPTVLELNAIDNEEQKSVLMALLLIQICVYTKQNHKGDGKLKNLLLLDEAHVLFKAQQESGEEEIMRYVPWKICWQKYAPMARELSLQTSLLQQSEVRLSRIQILKLSSDWWTVMIEKQ